MAKRWTLKEDYIVGKFCGNNPYFCLADKYIDELMSKLSDAGFNARSRNAVQKRVTDYWCLFTGYGTSKATKQVITIFNIINDEGHKNHLEQLQGHIQYRKQSPVVDDLDTFSATPNDLHNMVHVAKGRKFIDELDEYIRNSDIRPKSRIYRDVGMSQETYSAIRRGKYKTVSRENIYKLCFGLRLNYDDALKLMKSIGITFRNDSVLDAVVEYFLMQGPTVDSTNRVIPEEDKNKKKPKLVEKICYIYDTYRIDADLIESNEPELFWGFREGDDSEE